MRERARQREGGYVCARQRVDEASKMGCRHVAQNHFGFVLVRTSAQVVDSRWYPIVDDFRFGVERPLLADTDGCGDGEL